MKPLVSIIMPAYNASSFIGEAIKSVQKQTYKNWQLCIVDDGSEDMTWLLAQQFANEDNRIVVSKDVHYGCPTARNTCLAIAKGDIIARLDADDTDDPVRLEMQVNRLLKSDDDIVTCNMNWLRGHVLLRKRTGPMHPQAYMAGTSNGPCCASIVAWRKVYDKIGNFDPNLLAGSDGDWNFRAIIEGFRWGHLGGYWYNQRRHTNQLSQAMRGLQRKVHGGSREKYLKLWRKNGRTRCVDQ